MARACPPLLLLLVVAASACAPAPVGHSVACESDEDCRAGALCADDGRCLALPDAGSPSVDGGRTDGGRVRLDGGDDAGPLRRDGGRPGQGDLDDGGERYESGPLPDGPVDDRDPDAGPPPDGGDVDGGDVDRGDLDGGDLDGGDVRGPVLLALHPELAAVGDAITLEGRFPAGEYTLSFGGVEIGATVALVSSRLSTTVPPGARSGPLKVETLGQSTAALPFRVTSFAPNVGPFSTALEQTIAARELPETNEALGATFAFASGRYLYLLDDDTGGEGIAERARVYADGTLGPFVSLHSFSPPSLGGRAYVQVGPWLYALGGDVPGSSMPSAAVDRAPILPDGQLGSFTSANVELAGARSFAQAVVIGPWLYVLGGRSTDFYTSALDTLERALIDDDGGLGPFTTLNAVMDQRRDRATAVVSGDSLYVIGGSTDRNTIERAPIDDDGDLGAFLPVTVSGYTGRRSHASLLLGDELCLLGGQAGTVELDSVECAPAVGSVLAFTARAPLGRVRARFGVAVLGNRLVVLGGLDDLVGGFPPEWAPLELGAFASALSKTTTTLPPLHHPACAVVEDRVVVTGGVLTAQVSPAPTDRVYAAPVDGDGWLGDFVEIGSLSTPRARHRLAVVGDELWALGGTNGSEDLESVETAALGSTSLGFTPASATLLSPLADFYAFLADGSLYTAGGSSSGSAVLDVTRLELIDPNASFASWELLDSARAGPAGAAFGARVYVAGGGVDEAGTSVEESPLSPVSFSTSALVLNAYRHHALATVLGGRLYVIGGVWAEEPVLSYESVGLTDSDAPESVFTLHPDALPEEISGGCVVVVNNRVHIIGAVQPTGPDGEILSADLVTP